MHVDGTLKRHTLRVERSKKDVHSVVQITSTALEACLKVRTLTLARFRMGDAADFDGRLHCTDTP